MAGGRIEEESNRYLSPARDTDRDGGDRRATSVEIAPEEDPLKPEWGRLVASYLLDDPQARLKVQLDENKPLADGRQVLIVDRDRDVWKATIDLELHVRQGLIDVLRFDVPPQWVELDSAGQVKWKVVPIPSENRRQLIVRPLAPIAGDYALRITGRLVPSLGDRLGVGDVTPQGLGQIQHYVVLPQQLGPEQVVWDTPGLALGVASRATEAFGFGERNEIFLTGGGAFPGIAQGD